MTFQIIFFLLSYLFLLYNLSLKFHLKSKSSRAWIPNFSIKDSEFPHALLSFTLCARLCFLLCWSWKILTLFRCQCNRCLSPILGQCFWSRQWVGILQLQDKGGLRIDRGFQTLWICSEGVRHCFKAEPVNKNELLFIIYYLLVTSLMQRESFYQKKL